MPAAKSSAAGKRKSRASVGAGLLLKKSSSAAAAASKAETADSPQRPSASARKSLGRTSFAPAPTTSAAAPAPAPRSSAAAPRDLAIPPAASGARAPGGPDGRPTEAVIWATRRVLASLDPQASAYHPKHRPEDHVFAPLPAAAAAAAAAAAFAGHTGGEQGPAAAEEDVKPSRENGTDDEVVRTALSLAAFKTEMHARAGEAAHKESRRRSSAGLAAGPSSSAAGSKDAANSSAGAGELPGSHVDWHMYRDWPEGVRAEEEAMRVSPRPFFPADRCNNRPRMEN